MASPDASLIIRSLEPSSSLLYSNLSSTPTPNSGLVPMRVFLIQTARGLFSSSGGYKANISLLRYLASRGHSVRQLCYSYPDEAETYAQTAVKNGGRNPQLRDRLLHLRAEDGRPGTDVKIEELVMQDGVEFVALESEAFDAAFGGKNNVHKAMAKDTAEYIEVNEPPRSAFIASP